MRLNRLLGLFTPAALVVVGACGGNPAPSTAAAPRDPCTGAWVQLFDDANFSDRRLTIAYPTEQPSLRAAGTDVRQGDVNDRVSSARWSIPAGCKFVLYKDENFQGTRFQLIGSGRPEQNSRLGAFNDEASSGRWERS